LMKANPVTPKAYESIISGGGSFTPADGLISPGACGKRGEQRCNVCRSGHARGFEQRRPIMAAENGACSA